VVVKAKQASTSFFMGTSGLVLGAVLVLLSVISEAAIARESRAAEPPLVLAKEGYFYVGGHQLKLDTGIVIADAMFVQYQIPKSSRYHYPIVFVHGGCGFAGITWLGTPDDREGWAEYFLRRGYSTYVVDEPGCGRSAYYPDVDGALRLNSVVRDDELIDNPERYLLWPQARLYTQKPISMGASALATQYMSQPKESIPNGQHMDEASRDALAALLDKIGPSIIIAHSHGAQFAWLAADLRPHLVKSIIALEPAGPPFKDDTAVASSKPANDPSRAWGLTDAPITYEPSVKDPSELAPRQELAPSADLVGCWNMTGQQRKLPNLAGIPILILTSEAGYHARYDYCTSQFLIRAGVNNEHIRLEDIGIHGNGHRLAQEPNNLQIANVVEDWLKKHTRKR
jgi:pimeloyl-ACP methyl ester carboxylesterase